MARLTIYKDNNADTTSVPNRFIDEYISEANDAQLKVYLYLLRMLNAGQCISVSDIADKFNHTEKDVLRALKYWENKELLSLDYDSNGNLSGIRLCDFSGIGGESVSSSALPTPLVAYEKPSGEAPFYEKPSFEKPVYEKPAYNTQQLREFKEREETAQLLFIAQSYLGRPLTPAEMKSILFMMDVLHFSEDLIDYLIQYCVDRGKKDFKYIEKVAINWAEQGISTPKEAQKLGSKYDKNVYTIMNQLGKSTSPKELEYINRWTGEWGFTNDVIFEACERTVLATDKHRFEYADSILSKWKKENVRRKADIIRMDEMYQAKRRNSQKTISTNKFNQFTQNDYDFAQLERELLSN